MMEVKGYTIGPKADLAEADLAEADLAEADLTEATLRGADLTGANLREADLHGADLRGADLTGANLTEADLTGATLTEATLAEADLTGVSGLLQSSFWLSQFRSDEEGIIVYRVKNGYYSHPEGWVFEPGAILMEQPNPDRCTECGSGVSFATLDWIQSRYPNKEIWEARIPYKYLPDVVVPFNTNGKARCSFLELLRVV